jgi:peptide deformylase
MYDDRGGLDAERMTVLEMMVQFPLRLFNPVIVKREGKTTFEEACLSVPGFSENVTRANYIEVEATKSDNSKVVIKTDGLLAICLQHEIDHLDGKLFIDRLSTIKRGLIKSKIKKHGYPAREAGSKHLL